AAAHAGIAAFAAAQHLHLVGDDVRAVAVGAGVLVLPFACLEAAFDVDRTALLEVFTVDFGKPVIEHDAMPFGFFAPFARYLVFPLRRGGNGNIADGGAVRAVAHFRISSQVADENDFID